MRDLDGANDVSLFKELYRSDPEGVIRLFESQPSLHSNQLALAEYVKALVKVDRLDESALLKTLQRGVYCNDKFKCFCWVVFHTIEKLINILFGILICSISFSNPCLGLFGHILNLLHGCVLDIQILIICPCS